MMLGVTNPEHYFWKINSLTVENRPHGYEFSIFVSRAFLDATTTIDYDPERMQFVANQIAKGIGFKTSHERFVEFGEFGIQTIRWPIGGGTWLTLERPHPNEKGTLYTTHNCDGPLQQCFFLAIWQHWADFIECSTFGT